MEKVKVKKVITKMSVEDAIDHIPTLLNLMTLADIIPDGTAVYNTETGEMEELAPMIREANKDLQWLMDRALIGSDDAEDTGDASGESAPTSGGFTEKFISHAKEVDDAAKAFDKTAEVFHNWLSGVLGTTSIEDIEKTLKCGDPAIGLAEKNLLKGILTVKRAAGAKVAFIGFSHN